jgi:peptidoglycan/xylan/chitin deacetylase (PgdA/CDA1 family)
MAARAWRVLASARASQPHGELIEHFTLPSGDSVGAVLAHETGTVWLPFDADAAYAGYVRERWRSSVRPRALSERQLGLYYAVKRFIPRSWTLGMRRIFARWIGRPRFPTWPLDDSVVHLLRFYAHCLLVAEGVEAAAFRWFWPAGHRAALILTHDVESAAGLRLAVELADLEEVRGLRSSFNIVGADYPIDPGIVAELRARGFEIGVHGVNHDRSLFASRDGFEAALPELERLASELAAEGFRSPSTHRVIDWLGELPFSYDCSVPHSDPFEPQPGGSCTIWPYFLDDLVELPYTLPQDHTLFTVLGQRSIEPWLRQLDAIEARFGLAQSLTHPDPGYLADPDKRALYVAFLDTVRDRSGLWTPLPRDVARWWRTRASADGDDGAMPLGTMRRGEDAPLAVLEPPAG